MKYKFILFLLLFVYASRVSFADENLDRNIHLAAELCMESRSDTGFLAAKSTLLNCKYDVNASLYLKALMCFCDVSVEYCDEMFQIADDVINGLLDPLSTAVAWYRKSDISFVREDYKKALSFSDVSLNFLKIAEYRKVEGRLCWREYHEFMCHNIKNLSYQRLEDINGYEKEKKIMKETYQWLPDDFFKVRDERITKALLNKSVT